MPAIDQTAKKSLGQHFLRDPRAIQRIAAVIPEQASVLEIGPGPGAITEALLQRAGQLTLIERDDRFAAHWQEAARTEPKLSVIHGDVLEMLDEAVAKAQPEWIAGNLPYNISGPLTAKLAGLALSGGMVLMYQREVAERIAAGAGSKVYGSLSVLVRHHYHVARLLTLPPGAFAPPPKVHSAVIVLRPHHIAPSCDYAELERAVRRGFAHRRKTIANNFKGLLDRSDFAELEIDPGLRPEQLDYAAWSKITRALGNRPG